MTTGNIRIPPTDKDRRQLHILINQECTYTMPHDLIDRFINLGSIKKLARRECVIRVGDMDDDLYIIISGIMRTWYRNGEQEVTQAFGPPGAIVQSYHCYYEELPSSLNFEACCPVRLLHIRRKDFDTLVEESPEFARWNLRLAQCQLYHYEIKRRVINGTARERYEALIRHRPEIVRNVSLKVIATYLGVTPEYLSKLRRIIIREQRDSSGKE